MFGLGLGTFLLYFFLGGIIWILISALFLQWASALVVRNKPSYVNALGLSVLVYLIRIAIFAIAFWVIIGAIGLSLNFSSWDTMDFTPIYSHLALLILLILIFSLLILAVVAWIYGSSLFDATGKKIGFWYGMLVYILQSVFMAVIQSIYFAIKFFG